MERKGDPVAMRDAVQVPISCDHVIIIGSTEAAVELAIELKQQEWDPVVLCTMVIPSYFPMDWDCRNATGDLVSDPGSIFKRLAEKKIRHVLDNWVVERIEVDSKTRYFNVITNKGRFLCMSVVLCSEEELKKYGSQTKNHLGFYACPDKRAAPTVTDDVCFHLQQTTEFIRAELVEQDYIHDTDSIKLVPQKELVSHKLCYCC